MTRRLTGLDSYSGDEEYMCMCVTTCMKRHASANIREKRRLKTTLFEQLRKVGSGFTVRWGSIGLYCECM